MSSANARQRSATSALALVVIAILFVGVVVFANAALKGIRLDLTEDRLFTLSEGTEQVIRDIDEPIRLRFYFSSRLGREIPSIGIYAQRVRDMLEEFAAIGGDRIELEVHDPEPFTETEDRAVAFGLQGVPVDQTGEVVYFGLAGTNSTDQQEVIPFFDQSREQFLEYDLAKAIYNLAQPEKPRVGLITSLDVTGSAYSKQVPNAPDDSWVVYNQLQQFVDVEQILPTGLALPGGLDVIILMHATGLGDEMRYAIDQFVMAGGGLIVAADPHSEVDAARPRPGRGPDTVVVHSSSPNALFAGWGVSMPDGEVAGDVASARRVQLPASGESRQRAIDYPLWLALDRNNLTQGDVITGQLDQLTMASPGHLVRADDAAATFEPLLVTSDQGGVVDVGLVQQGQDSVLQIFRSFEPTGQRVLAARIGGTVPSAFPDGPPKPTALTEAEEALEAATEISRSDREEDVAREQAAWDEAKAAHIAEAADGVKVIAVADVDMFADPLWVRVQDFFGQRITVPFANNGNLMINAVDNLTGSEALISLRSRGTFQRPFTLVQEIERKAGDQFRDREQQLLEKLQQTEARLRELQGEDRDAANLALSEESQAAVEQFRAETIATRRELREVQFQLRSDVEQLTNTIRVVNIAAVPVLVVLFAIGLAVMRRSVRRRAGEVV